MTAEEFKEKEFSDVYWDENSAMDFAIEFAKMHVKAALEAKDNCLNRYGMAEEGYEDAYPLTNIK